MEAGSSSWLIEEGAAAGEQLQQATARQLPWSLKYQPKGVEQVGIEHRTDCIRQ